MTRRAPPTTPAPHEHVHEGPPRRARPSSAPTATPPATAWCRCRSPCRCRTTSGPRAPPSSSPRKMGLEPGAARARQGDGPGLHLLRRLRQRSPTSSTSRGRGRRARVPAADRQGDQHRDQEAAAPQARRRRRLHRHRRPHGRHRRHPQHQGLRRREGPGVLPRDQGGQPRRPGARARARRHGPGPRSARTPCSSARWSPRRTPTSTTRRRCRAAFREAYPAGQVPLLVVGGPRFEEGSAGVARRRPHLRPRHHPRRGRAATSSTSSPPARTQPDPRGAQR